MFIQVKLLNGFTKKLTYKIPEDWPTENLLGSVIKVPLKNRTEIAYVEEVFFDLKESVNFNIREAESKNIIPQDKFYSNFIKQASNYYIVEPVYFFRRISQFLKEKETNIEITSLNSEKANLSSKIKLTQEQQDIVEKITLNSDKYYPALIHGVTGSGKTEIYKSIINYIILQNKSVFLLLPEVSLAVQFYNLLKKELSQEINIYGFHSATSQKEKRELWQSLIKNKPIVILGVHLPILLPISNLGLIIIDEEHDTGYQEKKHPKINTKEISLIKAKAYNIPVVMGSATPAISSIYNAKKLSWNIFSLNKRFAGNFPKIKIVKLSENKNRENFWITKELKLAINNCLSKKEQIIIFINRRGYSFFMQCKNCGYIFTCLNCSVSLTVHNNNNKLDNKLNNKLKCHYCNYCIEEPKSCSKCNASQKELIKKGIGTQQIVKILEKLFPEAKIDRADLDATINKKRWQETINKFESGKIDILVGTQTITKGYNFSKVTLVGILWADINLGLPTYNACEVTLQQLIQVAGRSGRQTKDSLVIVQTMLDHEIYKYLSELDYKNFYNYEIKNRELIKYPPYIRLAELELKNTDQNIIDLEANKLANYLKKYIDNNKLEVAILGPAAPPVHMVKKIYIRKIYLKSSKISELVNIFKAIKKAEYKSQVFFTPNPLC